MIDAATRAIAVGSGRSPASCGQGGADFQNARAGDRPFARAQKCAGFGLKTARLALDSAVMGSGSDRIPLRPRHWLAFDLALRRPLQLVHAGEGAEADDAAAVAMLAARQFSCTPDRTAERPRRWLVLRAWTGDRWIAAAVPDAAELVERLTP
jgi:hypothetical protein